ncbi:MAG TPA: adenylate/guanylate cyclase domain-containing protein [Stellaceae bacterium]|nr:adenylate/guanylate cyclase domain-containing protein [Stellaceae bacterium]
MSGRLERAVVAFRRQEFGSSVAAIIGFLDILSEDARKQGHARVVADLERMRTAGEQLSGLIAQASDASPRGADETARLRHALRTPLNAIKGYGELLVEEIRESGPAAPLTDLAKVLDLADRLLGEIDRIVETSAAPLIDIIGNVLRTIRPLEEADTPDPLAVSSHILVVDDNASNRDLLSRRLAREGYRVTAAESGEAALTLTVAEGFDLVLLDLMMPGLSGFEVLCRLKADVRTSHLPVVMISALDELDSAVRCIAAGAEDYLPKPFNPVVLRARIGASLEKKRLLDELRAEKERSEALLLNILPRSVVERMRRGEMVIADRIPEATILFADLVDFTLVSAGLAPEQTVKLLGELFSEFDDLAMRHGLETIKTIGDGYMVTGGILDERPESAIAVAEMALSMLDAVKVASRTIDEELQLRIGIHTGGPVIAGVLGTHKIAYDVWGDAVNTAKRMETYGLPGSVHVSAATRKTLGNAFRFESRESLHVKGKGPMETYFLYRE